MSCELLIALHKIFGFPFPLSRAPRRPAYEVPYSYLELTSSTTPFFLPGSTPTKLFSQILQHPHIDDPLVNKMLAQPSHNLHLLFRGQTGNGGLDNTAHRSLVNGNETLVVDKSEEAHDELAVHAVRHAAVARDGIAEIFDVEGALEA